MPWILKTCSRRGDLRSADQVPPAKLGQANGLNTLLKVEPMTGIEPAYSAWEADVLPLNYIGDVAWEG
jgi:hypothetical protein